MSHTLASTTLATTIAALAIDEAAELYASATDALANIAVDTETAKLYAAAVMTVAIQAERIAAAARQNALGVEEYSDAMTAAAVTPLWRQAAAEVAEAAKEYATAATAAAAALAKAAVFAAIETGEESEEGWTATGWQLHLAGFLIQEAEQRETIFRQWAEWKLGWKLE